MKTRSLAKNLSETHDAARKFLEKLESFPKSEKAFVVGLEGDLGSGKTAFVQGVAKALGVEGIQSPTFIIEKIYQTTHPRFTRLVHVDAYRLESADELSRLGWHETISNPGNLVIVEWPERVAEIMPSGAFRIRFSFVDENTREIEF